MRQMRGLTQEALAEAIERSVETVSNIERGETSTRLSTAIRLAEALGVELVALFGDPLPPKREHPLIEEMIALLAGKDPATLQAVLDQARILVNLTTRHS